MAEPVTKHKYLALSIYHAIYSKVFGQVLLQYFRLIKVMSTLSPRLHPVQTPKAHDTTLFAFGARPEPLELRGEVATCLWVERQTTAQKGFKKQFLAASQPYASRLRLEPICASVLLHFGPGRRQRSLLRSSATSCAFQEQRRTDAMCPCRCASHPVGPSRRDRISTKRKVGK